MAAAYHSAPCGVEGHGLPAGEVARRLGVPSNTISAHLATRRDGRSVIHTADLAGLGALPAFLLEECCGGRPDLCAPLLDMALGTACCPR